MENIHVVPKGPSSEIQTYFLQYNRIIWEHIMIFLGQVREKKQNVLMDYWLKDSWFEPALVPMTVFVFPWKQESNKKTQLSDKLNQSFMCLRLITGPLTTNSTYLIRVNIVVFVLYLFVYLVFCTPLFLYSLGEWAILLPKMENSLQFQRWNYCLLNNIADFSPKNLIKSNWSKQNVPNAHTVVQPVPEEEWYQHVRV